MTNFEMLKDYGQEHLLRYWDELTEEEMVDRIWCPICHEFPFKSKEIQVYDVVRIVCFKTTDTTDEGGK